MPVGPPTSSSAELHLRLEELHLCAADGTVGAHKQPSRHPPATAPTRRSHPPLPTRCPVQVASPFRSSGSATYGWLGEHHHHHDDEAAELAALLHEAAPNLAARSPPPPLPAPYSGSRPHLLHKARSYELSETVKDRLRAAVPIPSGALPAHPRGSALHRPGGAVCGMLRPPSALQTTSAAHCTLLEHCTLL